MQSTWDWAIPCWGKVAVARGKRGLGKVANVDWHEISACAIKNSTFQLGSQISKIAIFQRSNTAPASAATMGGARRPCPRGARSTVQWIGTTLGRLQRCRPTSRARRRTRGAGVCPPRPSPPAAAGPTRRGQATCAAVLAQPRARLRAPPFTSSASPRARVRRRAAATARTDATELWAPGALRLPLSGSTTHAQSQR